jgi:translation initiation factor IF-2
MEKGRERLIMASGKHAGNKKINNETLALVLKTDTAGTEEAIISGLNSFDSSKVSAKIIYAGIGDVSKSDLFMAGNGSRLVEAFNVGLLPRIKESAIESGIEIHIHNVIYKLMDDVKEIARTMAPFEEEERITGRAKVIALFPSDHKAIILGCQVMEGNIAVGKKFRIISDPGMVYAGTIDSLHIESKAVKEASAGQQAGLKVSGFKRAKVNDLVECYEILPVKHRRWQPRGGTFDMRSGGS